MLNLGDLQSDAEFVGILQLDATSPEGISRINTAIRRLVARGDWVGTLQPTFFCARNGCLTFPREFGSVRAMNVCSKPIPIRGMFYDFLEKKDCWGQGGWGWGTNWRWFGHIGDPARMVSQDSAVSFDTIWGEGRFLRFYPRLQADIGKTITIYGKDNNGQPLQQQDANNNWIPGNTLVLTSPFVSTTGFIRYVDRILKDPTQGIVDAFAYNAAMNQLEPFGHYQPTETEPSYIRYNLDMGCFNTCTTGNPPPTSTGSCCQTNGVAALIKLRFIPAAAPTDLIIIDNIDALKLEVQAITFENAGDSANKRAYEADAVHELNRQLEDSTPDDQLPINYSVFGGPSFTNQCY